MPEKFETKTCCGRKTISFKIKKVNIGLIDFLKTKGYKEHNHFTKAGMLYMDIPEMIISGQINNSGIFVKCRKTDCSKQINDLELYLSQYEKNCL